MQWLRLTERNIISRIVLNTQLVYARLFYALILNVVIIMLSFWELFCLSLYICIYCKTFFASALHDRLYMTGMLYEILSILSRRLRKWSQANVSIHNMCRVLTNWYPIMVLENWPRSLVFNAFCQPFTQNVSNFPPDHIMKFSPVFVTFTSI